MTALGRLAYAVLLAGLLLIWIVACGAVFWFLYSQVEAGDSTRAVDVLQAMLWPFTVVMLGFPLLIFLAFGGMRVIRELVSLQGMVARLPADIEAMRGAAEAFKGVKDDIGRARDDLVRARTDISLATSEMSQALAPELGGGRSAEERQPSAADGATDSPASTPEADPPFVQSFERMYRKAKRLYRAAVQKFTQSHPDDANFNVGDDWPEVARRLRDLRGSYFDPGPNKDRWYADWVIEMIETERSTRRNRVGRLNPEIVKRLEENQPPD